MYIVKEILESEATRTSCFCHFYIINSHISFLDDSNMVKLVTMCSYTGMRIWRSDTIRKCLKGRNWLGNFWRLLWRRRIFNVVSKDDYFLCLGDDSSFLRFRNDDLWSLEEMIFEVLVNMFWCLVKLILEIVWRWFSRIV